MKIIKQSFKIVLASTIFLIGIFAVAHISRAAVVNLCGVPSSEAGAGEAPVDGPKYYVDQMNPSAADSNPGSESQPWLTLEKAAAMAKPGDTIIIKAGIYIDPNPDWDSPGRFTPAASGTSGNPIVFLSEPRGAAVIRGLVTNSPAWTIASRSYVIIDGFRIEGQLYAYGTNHVTFKNNELIKGSLVSGTDTSLHWGIAFHSTEKSLIRNNYVHDMDPNIGNRLHNTAAIMIFGTSSKYNVIERNDADAGNGIVHSAFGQKAAPSCSLFQYNVARNAKVGFLGMATTDSSVAATDNIFTQNIILNSKSAFDLDHVALRFAIYNNTASGVERFFSAYLDDNKDARVWNNIAVGNTSAYSWSGYNTRPPFSSLIAHADHNCLSGFLRIGYREASPTLIHTTLADWQTATGLDGGTIVGNPQFVNAAAGDVHLTAGSPCAAIGVDEQDYDNDGNTAEQIPAGAYITGSEIIGYVAPDNMDTVKPAAPKTLVVR